VSDTLDILREEIGTCREWIDDEVRRCSKPSDYVLWGKLIPADGLGPRCYDHAAKYVGHSALDPDSGWALVNLVALARRLDQVTA
jgi:hypothetical protein